ncbi:MAG: hypothetical protein EOP10_24145 [Proteobacteria bacterium]|nr:MAG: hypothetical protein EOP10_24145 [Pseudomonadota bacterium]
MKNLFIRLLPALCLSMPVLAAGKVAPYQAVIRADLTAKVSPNYTGASLHVDGRTGVLDLTLQPKMPECAEGMMCAQVMPEAVSYTLENATTETDSCGIIRTRALVDNRPSDGIYLSVIVNNNRANTCPSFVAMAAMDVIVEKKYYDRFAGQEVSQIDTFEADDFALINPAGKDQEYVFNGQLVSAKYQDKTLSLKLSHSGGCKQHAFDLKWGECKNVKLLNSVISECNVEILHTQGSDDMCKAFITQTYKIDLSGLAQAYIINLNGTRVLVH